MKITDISGKHIKIGKTSITVKNPETDKTCGVVNNIRKFHDLQPNKKSDYFKKIKAVWESRIDGLMDCVLIVDDNLYYLDDLKPIEFYKKYLEGKEGFESEEKRYNERVEIAENMKQYATVISCYVD